MGAGKGPRGKCPDCGYEGSLTPSGGVLRKHPDDFGRRCSGSGKPPVAGTEVVPEGRKPSMANMVEDRVREIARQELDQVLSDLASVSIPGNSRQAAVRYAQQKLRERMGVQR